MKVVNAVLLVPESIIAKPQINRRQKLAIHISQLLVVVVVLNCFLCVLTLSLAQQLIVHSDTVVSQGLSMCVVDAFTDLQKPQIKLDSLLVLLYVVIKDADRVVWSALISDFTSASATKCQHFVVLKSSHGAYVYAVLHLLVGRHWRYVVALSLVQARFLFDVAGGCVKEEG